MSDSKTPVPEEKAEPKARKRRRWRRWLLILAIVTVVLRLGFGFAMPWIVDRAFGDSLTASYEASNLSLLTGWLEIRQLELRPSADKNAEPVVQIEYVELDLDVSALLFGEIRVHRAEVDGVSVFATRNADGSISIAGFGGATESAPTAADAPEKQVPEPVPAPPDFSLPLRVDAARLQHLQLFLRDANGPTPTTATIECNARISHLGSPERESRIEVFAHGPELLDGMHAGFVGHSRGQDVAWDFWLRVRGVHGSGVATYLRQAGIESVARLIHLEATGSLRIEPATRLEEKLSPACTASLTLRDLKLRSDEAEAFAVDVVDVTIDKLTRREVHGKQIAVRGVRGNVSRTASGKLRAAGFDFGEAPPAKESPTPATTPATTPAPAGQPMLWSLQQVALEAGRFTFVDSSVQPAATLTCEISKVHVGPIDPQDAASAITLQIDGKLPGIANSLSIVGSTTPFGTKKSLTTTFRLAGIAPERLAPYLHNAGLESTLRDANVVASLSGRLETGADGISRAELTLDGPRLAGTAELLSLGKVAVRGIEIDPGKNSTQIGEVAITETRLPLRRDVKGAFHFFGIRTDGTSAAASRSNGARQPAPSAAAKSDNATFRIDRVRWSQASVTFADESMTPRVDIDTTLDVEVTNLVFGPDSSPAKLRASLAIKDICEKLELSGTFDAANRIAAKLELSGTGLDARPLRPYLAAANIEPTLDAGRLAAKLQIEMTGQATQKAKVRVADVTLHNGDAELIRLDELRVDDALFDKSTSVGEVAIRGFAVHANRDADGGLHVAGLRLAAAAAPGEKPAARPTQQQTPTTEPAPFALARLRIEAANLHWRDATTTPAVQTKVELRGKVDGLRTGKGGAPATFEIGLRVPESLEDLTLAGTLKLDPQDLRVDAKLRARGLRAGSLAPYVSKPNRVTLRDGRLRADLQASWTTLDISGNATRVTLKDVDYRENDARQPFFAVSRIALVAPRIDMTGGVITIDEALVEGVALHTERNAAGELLALGMALGTPTGSANAAPVQTIPRAGPPARPTDGKLPTITLNKLEVRLDELTFQDNSKGDAKRLHAALRLFNPKPLVLLNEDPAKLPPLELRLTGKADPLVDAISLDVRVSPFTDEPSLHADLAIQGIRADELTKVMPQLAKTIVGADMRDGVLQARLDASLRLARRSPVDFDLGRGFGCELQLDKLELRDKPGGTVLVGLDALRVDAKTINPRTGTIHVQSVELDKPTARFLVDDAGVHAFGLIVRGQDKNPETAPVQPGPQPAGQPKAADGGELRIDQILITGLDLHGEDRTAQPPVVVPLTGLDVEIKGFTSRALTEPRPIQFSAIASAGAIDLPRRDYSSLVGGLLSAAASAVTGGKDKKVRMEERGLFEELALRGRLVLHPQPSGWAKLDLSGFELAGLRGLARKADVEIGDGVLESHIKVRLEPKRGTTVDSKFTLRYLSLSEPPNGIISRYLKLPAPLDTVLFVLRNSDGEQQIPVDFTLDPKGGLSGGQIARTAVTTLGKLIADAIAASPFRIAGGALDLVGLGGGDPVKPTDQTLGVAFLPGDTTLSNVRDQLTRWVPEIASEEKLAVIVQHELGGGDLRRGEILANPSAATCHDIAERLRQRKKAIYQARQRALIEARTANRLGTVTDAAAARTRVRGLDGDLARTEAALDSIYRLLRPGADRRKLQRTREACLAIATQRLAAVKAWLIQNGVPETRIDVRTPRFKPAEGDAGGKVTLTPRAREQ